MTAKPALTLVEPKDRSGDAVPAPATRASHRANLRCLDHKASVRIAGPSERFVKLTRDPDLPRPTRFEPTVKSEGDIVL